MYRASQSKLHCQGRCVFHRNIYLLFAKGICLGRWKHRVPNASSSSDISKLLIGFPEGVANGEVKSPDVVRLGTASGGASFGEGGGRFLGEIRYLGGRRLQG